MDTDSWVKEYDTCKELTQEIVQLIQVPRTLPGHTARVGELIRSPSHRCA
jgi:hypothetical protein